MFVLNYWSYCGQPVIFSHADLFPCKHTNRLVWSCSIIRPEPSLAPTLRQTIRDKSWKMTGLAMIYLKGWQFLKPPQAWFPYRPSLRGVVIASQSSKANTNYILFLVCEWEVSGIEGCVLVWQEAEGYSDTFSFSVIGRWVENAPQILTLKF